ncbi:biotin/lipoyl-binding protein [Vibrio lentus]|nr:biotin/lipoyl-binding protein [Vibrio lentus]
MRSSARRISNLITLSQKWTRPTVPRTAPEVGGDIETFSVRMGQEVKKGQVLAVLDAADYRIAVDAAQQEI